MRSIFGFVAALLIISPPAVAGGFDASGAGAFASGVMQGYQQGQMQQLCVEAMQSYLRGAGPPPPPSCSSAPAPQPQYQAPIRRPLHCTTTHYGGSGAMGWDDTTCY